MHKSFGLRIVIFPGKMGLDDYIIIEKLGMGCFSEVYAAIHKKTGTSVAIKAIDKFKSDTSMIRTEIESMKLCGLHPNIVEIYDTFEDLTYTYIILEYCKYGSLHDFIVKHGPVPELLAKRWFVQLALAVSHCHAQNVINRDIKNANIFLDDQLNIKLGDFGLAIITPTDPNHYLLDTATGSPVFAAPEIFSIFEGKSFSGPRSEMWAMGCVLHSCLSQSLPFTIEDYQNTWSSYRAPSHASESCQDLLYRLVEVDPRRRLEMRDLWFHPWVASVSIDIWFSDIQRIYSPVTNTQNICKHVTSENMEYGAKPQQCSISGCSPQQTVIVMAT